MSIRTSSRTSTRTHASAVIAAVALLVGSIGFTACSAWSSTNPTDPETSASAPEGTLSDDASARLTATTVVPEQELTVLNHADAAAAAIAMSSTLFASSPAVILTPAADIAAQILAASAAVQLGVPVLVAPSAMTESPPADRAALAESVLGEAKRLAATSIITIGDVDTTALAGATRDIISLPAESAAIADALTTALGGVLPHPLMPSAVEDEDAALSAVAGLTRDSGALPHLDETATRPTSKPSSPASPSASASAPAPASKAPASDASTGHDALPSLRPPEALTGTVALATDSPEQLAAVATARAAGVSVTVLANDEVEPLTSTAIMRAMHETQPEHVLALGSAFANESALTWQLAVAKSGQQLPGGGGSWFPNHTLVAIYGTPGTGTLGILGEQNVTKSIARAKKYAAPYDALTKTTIVPAFEIIATVAAGSAGGDGDYSNEMDIDTLIAWATAAEKAGVAVIIDLQPGRTDFLTQAKQYEALLKLPNVGLALDPEWRLKPKQVPLEQIGSVNASEVNAVITWLADLTRDNTLPQKLFVLHQFQNRMIQDRPSVDTSRSELAMLIHADGQGSQPDKQATWAALHVDAPAGIAWGWKNFIDEDHPMLTPKQTMHVRPVPNLITYQ